MTRHPFSFDADDMLRFTKDLYGFGCKRPGTVEGAHAEAYLFGVLSGFGIPDVRAEEVPFWGWFHDKVYLAVHGAGGSLSFSPEPIVYTAFTPAGGITAPVVDVGKGSPDDFEKADLSEKIALVAYDHGWLQYDTLESIGYFLHDPADSLRGKGQVMSWVTEEERRVYQAAVDAGAVGFIGIFPLDTTPYLCFEGGNAFSGRFGPIPGVGLRKSEGEALKKFAAQQDSEVTIVLTGEKKAAVTRNIVGIIPGKSDRILQVTSHHDSMWLGATEDAAGVAVVLALAKECARAYANQKPPLTLAFVLEAAECLFVLGSRRYIGRHRDDLIKNLVCDLHIEHLALECVEDDSGALVKTGDIQARGLFVTDRGPLREIAREAVVKNDLVRTIILPTDTPLGVPTDATAYAGADLPVISFISPPLYWNSIEDTLDKVAVDQFVPTANAYADIIMNLFATDPDEIRKPGPPTDGYIRP
jgi:hypothetical protein